MYYCFWTLEKIFLLWNDLLFQAKLKKKSIENFTVSTIPADGISWIKPFWEPAAAQQNLCPCQHQGSTAEAPRICGSGQLGRRDFLGAAGPGSLPTQLPASPTAPIPRHHKNLGPSSTTICGAQCLSATSILHGTAKDCRPRVWLPAQIFQKILLTFCSHHLCRCPLDCAFT